MRQDLLANTLLFRPKTWRCYPAPQLRNATSENPQWKPPGLTAVAVSTTVCPSSPSFVYLFSSISHPSFSLSNRHIGDTYKYGLISMGILGIFFPCIRSLSEHVPPTRRGQLSLQAPWSLWWWTRKGPALGNLHHTVAQDKQTRNKCGQILHVLPKSLKP